MTNLCIGLIILYREEMAKEMSDLLSRWVVTFTFPSSQNDMKMKKNQWKITDKWMTNEWQTTNFYTSSWDNSCHLSDLEFILCNSCWLVWSWNICQFACRDDIVVNQCCQYLEGTLWLCPVKVKCFQIHSGVHQFSQLLKVEGGQL